MGDKIEAAARIVARGKVQGVGFRYFILQRAQEMRLRGFTQNLAGDEVEAIVEGDKIYIEDLFKAIQRGPATAKVKDVSIVWRTPTERFRTFEIRR